jgi:hypothetical protein
MNYSESDGIDWPQFNKYMPNIAGVNILLTLVVGMALWEFTQKSRWAIFFYMSLGTFAMILTQQRSLFIALLIGFGVLTAGAIRWGLPKPLGLYWLIIGAILAGSLLWGIRVGIDSSKPNAFLGPLVSLSEKAGLGGLLAVDDTIAREIGADTARFRQDAWREAWRRILENPVLGEGLGKRFNFYDSVQETWRTSQPHGAHISILYKTGAAGLVCFLGVHFVFCKMFYEKLMQDYPKKVKTYLLGLAASIIALQAYGFLNILFERRSLAFIYWSLMGVASGLLQWSDQAKNAEE